MIGVMLFVATVSSFVVLPLAGWPPVTRVAPIVLSVAVTLGLAARPWKWPAPTWSRLEDWNPSDRAVGVTAVTLGLIVFWFVLTRFRSGDINAIDFTVYYDRPNFQTLLGRPLYVESADDSIRAFRTCFAVHAHWVMLPFAGLYFIWATPLWLLALSVIAVTIGAVYTLRIIQLQGGGGLIGGASAFAFVLNDNTARTLNYGFHVEVLYAWFIPWMIYEGLRRRWRPFAVAALACIAVKEDAFLPLIAVAASLVLASGRDLKKLDWVWVTAPIALALLNLVAYYGLLVPRVSATGAPFYASYWANYGPTAMTAFAGMLGNPGQVLSSTLGSGFTSRVIVPHLYLPLIGWRWMLGAMPIVFLYGSSANEQLRAFGIYYAIVLVPLLVLGAAAGAERVATLLVGHRGFARVAAATAIVVGALVAGISNGGYSLRPWKSETAGVSRILSEVGRERAVLVQSGLYPHAGYDSQVQLLTKGTLADPRYGDALILLAPRVSAYPLTAAEVAPLYELPEVARSQSGLRVVKRDSR
jgi:uncharacterized membrane protein